MTYINDFFTAEAIHKFLVAVILLVIGVLAIRIMLRMIKKTLSNGDMEYFNELVKTQKTIDFVVAAAVDAE